MQDYNEATEDEYNGYAREIVAMLARHATAEDVFAYLKRAATENMGLTVFQEVRARRAARLIVGASPDSGDA